MLNSLSLLTFQRAVRSGLMQGRPQVEILRVKIASALDQPRTYIHVVVGGGVVERRLSCFNTHAGQSRETNTEKKERTKRERERARSVPYHNK